MKRISTNLAFWVAICGICSYGLVYFLIGHEAIVEVSSSLALGGAIMIAMTWSASAAYAVRTGAREGEGLLALGIFVLASAIAYNRIYATAYRWLDRPEWLLNSPFNPLGPWSIFWGLAIILLAPGTVRGNVPNRNFIYVVFSVGIGCLIAGITIGIFFARAAV